MKEVFEEAFVKLVSKLDSAEKFVLEQTPEVCKELLVVGKTEHLMDAITYSIVFILSGVASVWFAHLSYVTVDDKYSEGRLGYVLFAALFALPSLFSLYCAYIGFQALYFIKIAPKTFLIKRLRSLCGVN